MVDLLVLADNCEQALGRYVLGALEEEETVSIQQCRKLFGTNNIKSRDLSVSNIA